MASFVPPFARITSGIEEQHHVAPVIIRWVYGAMIQITSNHHQVVFSDREQAILHLESGLAGDDVVNLKVAMAIQPNAIAAGKRKEADIDR